MEQANAAVRTLTDRAVYGEGGGKGGEPARQEALRIFAVISSPRNSAWGLRMRQVGAATVVLGAVVGGIIPPLFEMFPYRRRDLLLDIIPARLPLDAAVAVGLLTALVLICGGGLFNRGRELGRQFSLAAFAALAVALLVTSILIAVCLVSGWDAELLMPALVLAFFAFYVYRRVTFFDSLRVRAFCARATWVSRERRRGIMEAAGDCRRAADTRRCERLKRAAAAVFETNWKAVRRRMTRFSMVAIFIGLGIVALSAGCAVDSLLTGKVDPAWLFQPGIRVSTATRLDTIRAVLVCPPLFLWGVAMTAGGAALLCGRHWGRKILACAIVPLAPGAWLTACIWVDVMTYGDELLVTAWLGALAFPGIWFLTGELFQSHAVAWCRVQSLARSLKRYP